MKRARLAGTAMVLFFLAMTGFIVWVNYHKPHILVLHSYDNDYVWTTDVNTGLKRVLEESAWVSVRYHYMKTKKFNDKESLRRAGLAARAAIDQAKPDVLIAVDDYAQELAAKYYIDDPKIRIVFAGLNGSETEYGYDKAHNVTGILERKPIYALQEAIRFLASKEMEEPRALFLADGTLSSVRDAETLAEYDWSPVRYQGVVHAQDYATWQREVEGLAGKADFLLVGGYRQLPRTAGEKQFVPPREVMTWTELHSPIPVIGMNVFNTGDGAMLSVGVSPYEQGEVAARMALAVIGGQAPHSIPVQTSRLYVVALRQSALTRRGLQVPRVFEAFARATDNYFE